MALILDEFKPADLTGFGRTIAEAADNSTLTTVFPNQTVDSLTFTWRNNERVDDLALYRSAGAETKIGDNAGYEEVTARLAHLGLKKLYSEDEAIQSLSGGQAKQARVDQLAAEVSRAVVNKLELLRGQALENGTLSIQDRRFVQNIDFQRNPDFTTTAGTLFSADGSDPVEYISSLVELYRAENGEDPTTLITSARVFAALTKNANLIAYSGNTTGIVSREVVQATLSAYGLPTITVYDKLVGGQRVTSDNKLFLASTNGAGATVWGPTAAALNPKYGIAAGQASGLFVGAYTEEDADNTWVRSDATALPILGRADLTLAATVL
jgi:hypothetical protein